MSDLVFSLEAMKQGKEIMLVKRRHDYIQIQEIPIKKTIFGMHHKNEARQIEYANEIFKLI